MDWIKHIIRLVVAMLLQILLVNHLQLFGVCQPYIYIIFLIMIPPTLPRVLELVIGFGIGLMMDICCNSLGVHAASCTMMIMLRQPILERMVADYDRLTSEVSMESIGMESFAKYCTIMIVVHHAFVLSLSAWSLAHIWLTLIEIVVSSLISLILILGYNYTRHAVR